MTIDTALERVLLDPHALGERVVIVDESAGHYPLSLALLAGEAGCAVDIITPHLFVGEETQKTWDMNFMFPKLAALNVRMRPQHFVEKIDDDGVEIYSIWGSTREMLCADTVVLSLMRLPAQSLFWSLRSAGCPDVRRVGDALAPRKIEAVVYEGEQVGREI